MPDASIAAIMLVEHAITVENAGMVGGAPASISTSRAMLLHVRFGTTRAPHDEIGQGACELLQHVTDHRDRKLDGVEARQRAVDLGERRAHAGGKPDGWTRGEIHHGLS